MAIDRIMCAGCEVDPAEVERCLMAHSAVLQALVVAKRDALMGQVVKAFIVLSPKESASDELEGELARHVESELSAYAYPREFEFLERLPGAASGRVERSRIESEPRGVL